MKSTARSLTEGPLARQILMVSLPLALSNLLQVLFNMSDIAVVGRFSGSAALAAVSDVIRQCGADSRAARLCCVVSGASETVFFTASLYLGAANVKRARYAVPAALLAYAAGVLTAAWLT